MITKKRFFLFILVFLSLILVQGVVADECVVGQYDASRFCNVNAEWQNKLADESECQNNYECESNVCREGYCSESEKAAIGGMKDILQDILEAIGLLKADILEKDMIIPGQPKTMSINVSPVEDITVDVNEAVEQADVNASSLTQKPVNIAEPITTGETYKYFETETNIEEEKIESAVITFKVEKSWVEDNDMDEDSIALNRYNPSTDTWTKLTTTVVRTDSLYYYCEATSPGLSVYAITATKTQLPDHCDDDIKNEDETDIDCGGSCQDCDVVETCSDGLKNQGEDGIDCGGPCDDCDDDYEAECGNGMADAGEDCDNCQFDVMCASDEICDDGICVEAEKEKAKFPILFIILPILFLAVAIGIFFGVKHFFKEEVVGGKQGKAVPSQLTSYALTQLKKGTSEDAITQTLKQKGWTFSQIATALKTAKKQASSSK